MRKSTRPVGIDRISDAPRSESFGDVLAVFVSVESTDQQSMIATAATEVQKLATQIHCQQVVIVPFAHLSSDLMTESAKAAGILNALAVALDDMGLQTAINSFGYHKEFELHFVAKGHPGAVAYREVK